MTFQRKMLFGFSLMVLPALLIGVEAIRTNVLERDALQMLGQNMARTRTYSELETAMFNQSEIVWRYLSGLDPHARGEFRATGEVIKYWHQRWRSELRPNEAALANSTEEIQRNIEVVADSVFVLYDSGQREASYRLAQRDLRDRLLPELTLLNRDIYRQARESSVRGAYTRLEEIVTRERDALVAILIVAVGAGLLGSWLISRGLARPISQLRVAMARVGAGEIELPIDVSSPDEIGDLARSFAQMTASLHESQARSTRLNTELQRKVSQLETTQAQLVQSEKLASIGEMAAAVAHGIRNPLASLRAAAQVALRHPESASSREHLGVIIDEVDRLDRRVSHLLSFSKPAPYHPLRESVARLIEDLLPPFGELLREKSVTLTLDIAADLPDVRVDPMQLEQALVEIVSNALDAMPEGGTLRISAHASRAAAGDETVLLEIIDGGVGIPARVLASVFEPFFTTRPEGTGLGLAIAKRYVEQNGGAIEIDSTAGTGTTVRIRLPGIDIDALTAAAASDAALATAKRS
ncbi:MAG: ATP-binding protein [Gemmatimonadaceae bacterium]